MVPGEDSNIENTNCLNEVRQLKDQVQYLKYKNKELEETGFNNNNFFNNENVNILNNETDNTVIGKIIKFIWSIISLIALFLSFRCNGGFNFTGLLGAIVFGPLYVVYKLGTNWGMCIHGVIPEV